MPKFSRAFVRLVTALVLITGLLVSVSPATFARASDSWVTVKVRATYRGLGPQQRLDYTCDGAWYKHPGDRDWTSVDSEHIQQGVWSSCTATFTAQAGDHIMVFMRAKTFTVAPFGDWYFIGQTNDYEEVLDHRSWAGFDGYDWWLSNGHIQMHKAQLSESIDPNVAPPPLPTPTPVRAPTATPVRTPTPVPGVQPPPAPGNLRVESVGQTSVALAWDASAPSPWEYRIYRSTAQGPQLAGSTSDTRATLQALSCSTQYSYYVTVRNAAGESQPSNTVTFSTAGCGSEAPTPTPQPGVPVPAAPSDLHITSATQNTIVLAWTSNSNNQDSFIVYSPRGDKLIAIASTGGTSYAVSGLTCGTQYYFVVKAHNAGGESAPSNTAGGVTASCGGPQPTATTQPPPGPQVPAAPSNLHITSATQTGMILAWTSNSNNQDSFRLYFLNGGNLTLIGSTGGTSYAVSGLTCGTQYYFVVKAHNAAGESAPSNTAGGVTAACATQSPPPAPRNLRAADLGSDNIELTWIEDSTDVQDFKIFRLVNNQQVWIGATGATHFTTTITCNETYTYVVVAHNAAGDSPPSNWVQVLEECP